MPKPRRSAAMRLAVIAIYAIATAAIGLVRHDAGSDQGTAAIGYTLLPGGESVALCQHSSDDQSGPADGQSGGHACCEACVIAFAPGLGAISLPEIMPPNGSTITIFDVMAPAPISVWRAKPMSRGPPRA